MAVAGPAEVKADIKMTVEQQIAACCREEGLGRTTHPSTGQRANVSSVLSECIIVM